MRSIAFLAAFLAALPTAASAQFRPVEPGCAVSALKLTPAPPGTADAAGFFAPSYIAARARFRSECARAMATTDGFCRAIPLPSGADPDLTVDLAYLTRPGNQHLLILQSALHGAEGFAGSAVQSRLLGRAESLLGGGFDLLLIHAINPYGFKNTRRVDACNVDLNRNFPGVPNLYRTPNPDYDAVATLVERDGPIDSNALETARIKLETAAAALVHGFEAIAAGTHAGQYVNPAGFEFGGVAPRPQAALLRRELTPLIAAHEGDVFFLDLHTGLGPSNSLTLYPGNGWPDGRKAELLRLAEAAQAVWASYPRSAHGRILAEDPCTSPFDTSGDVIDFVPGLVPGNRVVAVTVEWGTVGDDTLAELDTNARQTLEHQAYFHGCVSDEVCRMVRARFATLFNPPDAEFQAAVLGEFDALLVTILARGHGVFAAFAKPDPRNRCPPR